MTGILAIVKSWTPKSLWKYVIAGAGILDAKGVMNVMIVRKVMIVHFFLEVKFSGYSGSSFESQPTTPSSRFVRGIGAAGMTDFPLLLGLPTLRMLAILDIRLAMLRRVWTLAAPSFFHAGDSISITVASLGKQDSRLGR